MLSIVYGKRRIFFLCLLLGTAVAAGLWFYDQAGAKPLQEAETPVDASMRIGEGTTIEQIFFFKKCKEREFVKSKPSPAMLNMDYQTFQLQNRAWNIESFRDGKIVMSIGIDDFCHEHKANRFLGEKDGHVAVFYGKPDKKPILQEVTSVSLDKLQPQAIAEIRQGLSFSSKAEMLYILEGMQSK